ncbi:uncharacterized protein LOC118766001 [Octopus sinensis]|uniref:Uncharacterized protein LOC118766001 n=1 Tax=Octopus sinensis TaxID=2607531 RepID=A0A7E6FAZ1_9MOLL|nr:uncharacterized protein LOC118766001 [Octopus sinensis]
MRTARIFLLGTTKSSKRSLLKTLLKDQFQESGAEGDEGVTLWQWHPFKNQQNCDLVEKYMTEDLKDSQIEIWELSDNQVFQKVHPIYYTSTALYVITCHSPKPNCKSVVNFINTIQCKNPGSSILIVMIVSDINEEVKGTRTSVPDQYFQFLLNSIMDNEKNQLDSLQEEMEQIRSLDANEEATEKIKLLTQLLHTRPKLPKQVHVLNFSTNQGSDIIQSALLRNCIDQMRDAKWEHQKELDIIRDKIVELKESQTILATWSSLQEYFFTKIQTTNQKLFEKLMSFLHKTGGILDLQKCGWNQLDLDNHFICVNPLVFTKLLCRFHIAEETQEFRLTSSHFWPDKQNKPSVESLIEVLETVQVRGIIPETLFPVLWQEFPTLDESQVKLLLQVFISLGMLLPLHSSLHCSSLTTLSLPTYPTLSPKKYYYASVIDCFNDLRPQLNWTQKPFPGDLQISCWFRFILGDPPEGLMQRLLCCCHQAIHKQATYQHLWKHGVLIRAGDVMLCIEYTSGNIKRFHITGRINTDFQGSEATAIQMTWLKMAPLILAAISMLSSFHGLMYSTYLVPLGKYFYEPIETATNSTHQHVFSTGSCLQAWTHKKPLIIERERILKVDHLLPFEVQKPVGSISVMMEFILSKKEEICSQSEESPLIVDNYLAARYSTQVAVPKTKKKATLQIKWKLDEGNRSSQRTNNNIEGGGLSVKDNGKNSCTGVDSSKGTFQNLNETQTGVLNENEIDGRIMNGRVMSEENENSIAVRIASSFVASIMVMALAQHLVEESSVSVGNIAKITATTATAVQAGDIDAAVNAVFDVVNKVNDMLEVRHSSPDNEAPRKSKFCILM